MMVKIFLLLAVLGIKSIHAQFLEQPPAGNVFVPVNDQVTLSCSVEVGYGVDWEVRINNGEALNAALRIHEEAFMNHNFTFTGVATSTSAISFNIFNETGSQTNNDTTITCIAQLGVGPRERANETKVIYYDTPPPPTDLSVTEIELGSLNISWSLGFIEGAPVNYTLTVLNLNAASAQPIIIAGLLDQHYMFETSRPCDLYSFTVTAVTAAGNSSTQEMLFRRNSNDMCLTTPVPTTDATTVEGITVSTTDPTTTNHSTGLSAGAIAGIVIGIFIAVVIGIIITITVVLTCWKNYFAVREATPKQTGLEGPLQTLGSNNPIGLTASKEGVLVVENFQKIKIIKRVSGGGVQLDDGDAHSDDKVFQSAEFVDLGNEKLVEITVNQKNGDIFVTTEKKVLKLNSEGQLIDDKEFNFESLNGLCINSNDELYVCDTGANKIYVLDLSFNLDKTRTIDRLKIPRDVAFDEHNNVYIAEERGIKVVFPKNKSCWLTGKKRDNFNGSALKIVKDFIFVTHGRAASLYSTSGTYIRDFCKNKNGVSRPLGITVDSDDFVYVSTADGKVHIFKAAHAVTTHCLL